MDHTQANKALDWLRAEGFAIVMFSPEELGDVDPRQVQDRLTELGNEVIEDLTD